MDEWVINPRTGRPIRKGSKKYKELTEIKQVSSDEDIDQESISDDESSIYNQSSDDDLAELYTQDDIDDMDDDEIEELYRKLTKK